MEHNRHEQIYPDDYWKISVCEKCNALIYWYKSQKGTSFPVNVMNGIEIHRRGNYNNYVEKHNCEDMDSRYQLFVKSDEITDEVKEKVKDYIQQIAVTTALQFTKARSDFKKGMMQQAKDFLDGKSKYKKPFSPKQVMAIIDTTYQAEED